MNSTSTSKAATGHHLTDRLSTTGHLADCLATTGHPADRLPNAGHLADCSSTMVPMAHCSSTAGRPADCSSTTGPLVETGSSVVAAAAVTQCSLQERKSRRLERYGSAPHVAPLCSVPPTAVRRAFKAPLRSVANSCEPEETHAERCRESDRTVTTGGTIDVQTDTPTGRREDGASTAGDRYRGLAPGGAAEDVASTEPPTSANDAVDTGTPGGDPVVRRRSLRLARD